MSDAPETRGAEGPQRPRVVVAVDLGEAGLEALRQARELAHAVEGTLAAVHVLPAFHDLSLLFPARSLGVAADAAQEEAAARKTIEDHARASLGLELGTVFVERGAAYAEIVRRAAAWDAAWVVVGSHGRTGLSRAVLGSEAERVVRYAHCPVLVARPARHSGVVLVATDLSAASLPAIEAGAVEATRRDAKLFVISVLEDKGAGSTTWLGLVVALPPLPPETLQKEVLEAAQTTLEEAMTRSGAVGEARIVTGSPAAEIVHAAETLGAELVVVGTHGRTGLARVGLGSVAERVIRHAPCSVLAVRAGPGPGAT